MRGYDGDASSTRAAFVNGWLRTGDQGFLDADGYLFLTGRIKEIINRGGAKVSPQEIDAVLLEHPAIGHAVTFPLPHDELGESIAAAVVLQPGAHSSAQEIRAFVAARLSPFKVPSRIIITTHIPTGPTGKVQRFALSEQLRVRPLGPSRDAEDVGRRLVAPRDLLEARLLRIWESFFGGGPIGVADDFFDLGGHSLLAARLVEEIERASGRRLHPSILIEAPTVERLARAMLRDSARQPLLRIRDGHRSPLFFLNGDLNGGGFYCVKLASGLEPGQSFYSVSSHGIGGDPIPGSIEAIAASHIGAIRTVQPAGPYLLGGFSHAGLVAFEMASQLEAAGEKVALLFVVDVSADPALRRRSPGPVSRTLVRWGGRFTRLHREMSELGSRDRIALALHTLRRYGSRAASPSAVELDGSEMTKDGRRLFETYRRLMDRYVARPYSGRMTLVVSADDLGARSTDPMLGWGRLADVKVLSIPGTHVACVTRHVGILAEHLRASLREITI
jgi:thioesterase domain-containing protein